MRTPLLSYGGTSGTWRSVVLRDHWNWRPTKYMTAKYYVAWLPTMTSVLTKPRFWIYYECSVCFQLIDKISSKSKLAWIQFLCIPSLDTPVVAVDQSSSVDVSLGDQLTVRCTVLKSNPGVILGYEWSVLGDNDVIGRESYFTINRVSINDNKTLQCRARNSMGISEPADVRINVLCKSPS